MSAQHGPGGAAHLLVLAVLVVISLVVFGVIRWRAKRAAAEAAEPQSVADDLANQATRSTEANDDMTQR